MRQTLAWMAPVGVVALVTGGAAITAAASATPDLEPRTPEEVLAAVAAADVDALSGTLRTDADLGLPELPEGLALPGPVPAPSGDGDGAEDTEDEAAGASPLDVLTRFVSGENTVRFWVDGEDRFRADLVDPVTEARVVRDGDEAWAWSLADDTVTRFTVPDETHDEAPRGRDGDESEAGPGPTIEDLTPQELAERFLAGADETTEITTGEPTLVAGREAYVLEAEPRQEGSLVDRLVLAVDAETGLVLRFQVFAVDQRGPAFETGFVDLEVGAPDPEVFEIDYPEGATVRDADLGEDSAGSWEGEDWVSPWQGMDSVGPQRGDGSASPWEGMVPTPDGAPGVEVVGEGWAAVTVIGPVEGVEVPELPDDGTGTADDELDPGAQQFLDGLVQTVDGGQAVSLSLVSMLFTDDGRVLVGSVPVETLVDVAAR